jgi:autotransporter-associated beta strand protein
VVPIALRAVLALLVVLWTVPAAVAQQNYTWTGATNNTWNTTGTNLNWDAGSGNTAWVNGNNAIFGSTGVGTVAASTVTAASVQFNTSGYTITGSGLTLAGSAPTLSAASGVVATLNATTTVNGDLTVSGGGTVRLDGGNNQLGFTGTTTKTITVASGTTLQAFNSQNLSGNPFDNATALALGSGGTFIMGGGGSGNGTNISLGGLTGSAGSSLLNGATGTNNSSLTVVLANGATNTYNGTIGYVGGGLPANQSGRFTVAFGGNATLVLGGSNSYSGPTVIGRTAGGAQTASTTVQLASASALGLGTLSGSVSIGPNATLDLNGQAVTSNYSFVTVQGAGVGGAGSLVNSSATTPVSLSWGVQLSSASGSAIGGAGNLTLTGAVTNFGLLQKVGAGVLTLTNTSNSWTGGTSINAGTLRLGAANVLPGTTGSARLLINGGTLSTGSGVGFGDTDAGTLKVTGTGSKISLGTGGHTLAFASFDPTGFTSLTVDGWTGVAGGERDRRPDRDHRRDGTAERREPVGHPQQHQLHGVRTGGGPPRERLDPGTGAGPRAGPRARPRGGRARVRRGCGPAPPGRAGRGRGLPVTRRWSRPASPPSRPFPSCTTTARTLVPLGGKLYFIVASVSAANRGLWATDPSDTHPG